MENKDLCMLLRVLWWTENYYMLIMHIICVGLLARESALYKQQRLTVNLIRIV